MTSSKMVTNMAPINDRSALLAIETSSNSCSLALLTLSEVVAEQVNTEPNIHAKQIAVFAQELLEEAEQKGLQIEGIALSSGPGSYTGLRIGASFAKGYAFATGKPIVAISTLEALASGFLQSNQLASDACIISMIDAGRMEVYTASYTPLLEEISSPQAAIITDESFQEFAGASPIYFIGNGALKCQDTLQLPNASFQHFECLARNMQKIAFDRYAKGKFVNLAYWEPDYIKPYNAIVAKNKILNR